MIKIAESYFPDFPDLIALQTGTVLGDWPARAPSKTRAGTRKSRDGAWINGKLWQRVDAILHTHHVEEVEERDGDWKESVYHDPKQVWRSVETPE